MIPRQGGTVEPHYVEGHDLFFTYAKDRINLLCICGWHSHLDVVDPENTKYHFVLASMAYKHFLESGVELGKDATVQNHIVLGE